MPLFLTFQSDGLQEKVDHRTERLLNRLHGLGARSGRSIAHGQADSTIQGTRLR